MNIVFATGDHLIGDLDEDGSHSFRSIIVTRSVVNHFDGVDETRDGSNHADWIVVIERFTVAVQCVQVFNIVLRI
jgi:hypothetical protein